MGILDKWKRKTADWDSAYIATPAFYKKADGTVFGAIALTEGTETILPKLPQKEYEAGGERIMEWRLVLISTTKDSVVGEADYFTAVKNISKYIVDEKQDRILVKGLSAEEVEELGESAAFTED